MSTATKLKSERDEFLAVLQKIAHGSRNGHKATPGTEVRQTVRSVLVRRGIHWSPVMLAREEDQ